MMIKTNTNTTTAIFALLCISLLSTRVAQAQPPTAVDLGVLDMSGTPSSPSLLTISVPFAADSDIKWFKFTIPTAVTSAGSDAFFDCFIHKPGLQNNYNSTARPELYLFSGTGDIRDIAYWSRPGVPEVGNNYYRTLISHGIKTQPRSYADLPFVANGYNQGFFPQSLSTGTYYLATVSYTYTTSIINWNLTPSPGVTLYQTNGGWNITIGTGSLASVSAPEPGTLALIALGSGSMGIITRLRRNKRVS
jgi:hypothetical protein